MTATLLKALLAVVLALALWVAVDPGPGVDGRTVVAVVLGLVGVATAALDKEWSPWP